MSSTGCFFFVYPPYNYVAFCLVRKMPRFHFCIFLDSYVSVGVEELGASRLLYSPLDGTGGCLQSWNITMHISYIVRCANSIHLLVFWEEGEGRWIVFGVCPPTLSFRTLHLLCDYIVSTQLTHTQLKSASSHFSFWLQEWESVLSSLMHERWAHFS